VAFADMPAVYQEHDLFVLPSVDEPFAISPLEAMSFGLPVIVTDTNGAQSCVKKGETGFVIPSNDLSALTKKISFFIEDLTKIKSFGDAAHRTIEQEYSKKVFYEHFKIAIHLQGIKA
jgi:glycosyltransferase involved in cell wall biosynthesis